MHLIPTMNNARDTPLTTRARSDAAPLRAKLGALARAGPGHVVPLLRAKPATSAPAGRATRAGPGHAVPLLRQNSAVPLKIKKNPKKSRFTVPITTLATAQSAVTWPGGATPRGGAGGATCATVPSLRTHNGSPAADAQPTGGSRAHSCGDRAEGSGVPWVRWAEPHSATQGCDLFSARTLGLLRMRFVTWRENHASALRLGSPPVPPVCGPRIP